MNAHCNVFRELHQPAAHIKVSLASTLKESAVPTTKRVTPSTPTSWLYAAVVHTPPGVSCAQTSAGAIKRSTACGFCGCAAGQSKRPRDDGIERESAGLQDADENKAAGRVLPAEQVAHAPEQAALVRPARSPNVPAGQSVHEDAPAVEKVPAGQGVQSPAVPPGNEPAAHEAVKAGAEVLPEGQFVHVPEQEDELSAALLPKVPAGHNVQVKAAASEKVPGGQGTQTLLTKKKPALQENGDRSCHVAPES